MRVLFSSTAGLGHIEPMIPLAMALRERGHDLKWATAQDARGRLEARGIPTVDAGRPVPELLAEYGRRWPQSRELTGADLGNHMFPKVFGALAATASLADLTAVAASWRPDLVVHEAADFAAPILAHQLGVPNVTHSYGSVIPADRIAGAAAETAPLWADIGAEMPPFGGCFDHLYLDIYPPSRQTDDMTHIGRIAQLRPTSSGALPDEKLPPHVEAAVSAGRRLIYLTFGTVTTLNATFAAAVTAASTMDEMVVVTVGSNGNPGAFGSLPANVHIDTFISQSLLLPHCSLVASHAGSGTFLAALSHGLPQLCLPQAADQFRNASACASTGAGIALPGPQATEAAISQALHRLLTEPEFRAAAQLLQTEIAAMPAPASVAATLEQLVVNVDHSAG